MRLVSARIRGLGRLVDTTIKLNQKVIAIVGPNEAGKTTLLRALALLEDQVAIPPSQRSRAVHVKDATNTLSMRFVLDDDDRALVDDLDLAEAPSVMVINRPVDGGDLRFVITPTPRKDEVPLQKSVVELGAAVGAAGTLIPTEHDDDEAEQHDPDEAGRLLLELEGHQKALDAYCTSDPSERSGEDAVRQTTADLIGRLGAFQRVDELREPLRRIVAWFERPNPVPAVEDRLWQRTPDIALFGDSDRHLASTYTLDDALLANVPGALANLARLANLDLDALAAAIRTDQIARRDTMKNRANLRLREYFSTAWKQTDLTVELNVENDTLRIGLVEDGVHASVFDERSAGLRMFVALNAFLASRSTGRPNILLIDEAESHLHIDAQADLVQMFAAQDKADKIIYTTHSPACLPEDLGVGIRAVVAESDETSRVENSFWRNQGGFSSLMFAMGASAAAFTPARCAVVAEGASDMILLPSLIRAALGADRLPYQIAPGLSEVPRDSYPDLDFEAAKVAFLVDGDGAGDSLAAAIGREVPDDRVVRLGLPGAENLLDPGDYLHAFEALLREFNPGQEIGELPELATPEARSWAKDLHEWAAAADLRCPSKVDVAGALVQIDDIVPSAGGAKLLKRLHQQICRALDLGKESSIP